MLAEIVCYGVTSDIWMIRFTGTNLSRFAFSFCSRTSFVLFHTDHNWRTTKAFGLIFLFSNNLDTNATYKANKLVISKGWSSLGLDQKKPTCENPQIISISTWNNNMTIETNRTTQNVLNVPYFQSSNDKNGKLHIGYVIIWQNIAKKSGAAFTFFN